jgi:hypothetical protein
MTEENPDKEPAQQLLFADLVSNYQEGRDELNLAEFPISAIGNRLDPSVKTILFQDATFDKSTAFPLHLMTRSFSAFFSLAAYKTSSHQRLRLHLISSSRSLDGASTRIIIGD